jgi:hypothetical protein
MNCIFCGNESKKKWHIDCLDSAIEEEFGTDVWDMLIEKSLVFKKDAIPEWLENLIQEGVDEGRRYVTRFKIFCSLKKFNQSPDIIREKLLEFNSHCRPPELDRNVEYHVRYLTRRFTE